MYILLNIIRINMIIRIIMHYITALYLQLEFKLNYNVKWIIPDLFINNSRSE